jgi:hypothetical protein
MATQILLGKGATLSYSATSGGTYTAIAQAVSVSGPEINQTMIDQPYLTATLHRKRPGVPETPTASFQVYYDPTDAGHIALDSACTAGTLLWFKLALMDPTTGSVKTGATASFSAYVDSIPLDGIELDSNITKEYSLTLDSLPTWA